MSKQSILKNLPSVDELLRDDDLSQLAKETPRSLVKQAVRQVLENVRRRSSRRLTAASRRSGKSM